MSFIKSLLRELLIVLGVPFFKVMRRDNWVIMTNGVSHHFHRIILNAHSEIVVRQFHGACCIRTKHGLDDIESVRSKKILANMLSRLSGMSDHEKQKIIDSELPCIFIFAIPEDVNGTTVGHRFIDDYTNYAVACATEGFYYDCSRNVDITAPTTVQSFLNPFVFSHYEMVEWNIANRHANLSDLNYYQKARAEMLNYMVMIDEVVELRQ